jgi:ParB family transcriptional regulator, chromosome partitioning protein
VSKRKDALEALLSPVRSQGAPSAPERRAAATPGSVKVMGLALQSLHDDAEQAEALRTQLAAGDRVLELDPALVDRSPFRDRIEHDADPDFDALRASVAESGQQVPILVRPHPDQEGRFQAAYGHRRLRAAQALGKPVRAVVRPLTDAELVVAQGKENLERRDLSYIERAQFAATLEAKGFDRATILAAVEPNKGNLSVMLSIAKAVPADIIAAIGPAPKVGRPRWSEFAELVQREGAAKAARAIIGSPRFQAASTDARLNLVLSGLQAPRRASVSAGQLLKNEEGRAIGRIERGARSARLTLDDPAFAQFLTERLARLHAEFEAAAEIPGSTTRR